ncbi:uncharacterized protein N7482_005561 [Penicillium canariense]|uniref:Uncharacterized protein n=1 Tax=Penicillium canariense TaxID=189055 RepID=A0A9W9LNB4_9EURO|nr:uncharacterized protein N7482_005561 [Penicillium canariense]KAJ5166780.1 hypothetical protein N7482_005561 [Penicillium canariense]
MRDDYTEWERYSHPNPDEEDPPPPPPPTLDEIQTLQEFAERYSTSDAIPADDAARKLMSLADEDRVLLLDADIDMPRYQPAVLKLVEAIRALPKLERTETQISTGPFRGQN